LWIENPKIVGGENRLDSELVQVGKGYLLAKEGADGLLMVQTLPKSGERVQGCYIKLNSGYNTAYLGLALWAKLNAEGKRLNSTFQEILAYLHLKREAWTPSDQRLDAYPFQ
jgi:L-asparaginase II